MGAVVKTVPRVDGRLRGECGESANGLSESVLISCSFRNIAVEEDVKADSLVDGEPCWISNGVRGFTFGKIRLNAA